MKKTTKIIRKSTVDAQRTHLATRLSSLFSHNFHSVLKDARGFPPPRRRIVAVSGGFDPVHIGHVRLFNEARALGDYLIVIINNDNWLIKKKGYAFMPEAERKAIVESFRAVDAVMLTTHTKNATDMSVCAELEELKPDVFANGGDRKADNIPEYLLCETLHIEMAFAVGAGGKMQSSSELVKASAKLTQASTPLIPQVN